MPRKARTTRRIMHSVDTVHDEFDLRLLVKGLVQKKGLEWTFEFFSAFQGNKKKSLRKACAELGPMAVSVLLQALIKSDRWQDRIRSAEALLLYGGHKPVEKLVPSGSDTPPLHLHFDLTRLAPEELRQLRTIVTKAQAPMAISATAGLSGNGNGSGRDSRS